jgi:uncharacterized protein (DUF1786 family)
VRNHIRAGYRVWATPQVAYTFAPHPQAVEELGVTIVEDGQRPPGSVRLELRDLDLATIEHTFMALGVRAKPDAVAVAAFEHGDVPPGSSDRAYRYQYLTRSLALRADLSALAYMRADIPTDMPRMRAVAASTPPTVPLMVMDAAFAALLGISQDPRVGEQEAALLVNLGTMHTLAVHMRANQIVGFFEHHTDQLSTAVLDRLLTALADGTLTQELVWADGGHGALLMAPDTADVPFLAVSGPRCNLLCGSRHRAYFAAPRGDYSAPGCWGLLRAYATLRPQIGPQIDAALAGDP